MLVDANLLLYAVDRGSLFHDAARGWLKSQLNGRSRVGLPWQSLVSFLRLVTNPRLFDQPLSAADAWARVTDWLGVEIVWVPQPGGRHAAILGDLIRRYDVRGNLVPDAQLAALALEHGLTVYSTDSDFARFAEVAWRNPVAP